jgi:DNA-binding SARP family transcriptional activator
MEGSTTSQQPAEEPATHLYLLGGFRLMHRGTRVTVPLSAARLLAYLSLRRAASPRSVVAGQLYGESDEEHARASLRAALWRLRRVCPGVVRCEEASIDLADLWVDVDQVRHDVANLLVAGRTADASLVHRLRSDLLPGWYDDWLLFERERLRQHALFGLEAVASQRASEGAFAEAIDLALSCLQLDPLRERGHRLLIELHLAAGDRIEAARALEAYRKLLDVELGVAPSEELMRGVTEQVKFAPTNWTNGGLMRPAAGHGV